MLLEGTFAEVIDNHAERGNLSPDWRAQRQNGLSIAWKHFRVLISYIFIASTDFTSGTILFSRFSIPAFSVTVLEGQPLHDP